MLERPDGQVAAESPEGTPEGSERLKIRFPSPVGDVAMELRGDLVVKVAICPPEEELEGYLQFEELEPSEFIDELFGRLSEYFAGARKDLELRYDMEESGITGFARKVFREAAKIPYGRTRTYGRIAEKVGKPDAYRLVLATLVTNPLPIVIPCHRVVTNKSGIGSYVAGQEVKRWLMAMEKEALKSNEV